MRRRTQQYRACAGLARPSSSCLDSTIVRAVHAPPPAFGDVFELRVTLRHVEPAVWRSLRVPADLPLSVVHEVLQAAFGWKNCHLHDFRMGDIRFGMADTDDEIVLGR